MTREDLNCIYLQVAAELCNGKEWCWHGVDGPLPRFAALVAAYEREECAVWAESVGKDINDTNGTKYSAEYIAKGMKYAAEYIAKGIRARGQE